MSIAIQTFTKNTGIARANLLNLKFLTAFVFHVIYSADSARLEKKENIIFFPTRAGLVKILCSENIVLKSFSLLGLLCTKVIITSQTQGFSEHTQPVYMFVVLVDIQLVRIRMEF